MTHKHFMNFKSEVTNATEKLICDQCAKDILTGATCVKVEVTSCGGGPFERDWCFGCWKDISTSLQSLRGALIHGAH